MGEGMKGGKFKESDLVSMGKEGWGRGKGVFKGKGCCVVCRWYEKNEGGVEGGLRM